MTITLNYSCVYLSDAGVSCVEHRVFYSDEFLEQVAKPDCVYGGYDHIEEGHLRIIHEPGDYLLPQVHPLRLKVHVAAP